MIISGLFPVGSESYSFFFSFFGIVPFLFPDEAVMEGYVNRVQRLVQVTRRLGTKRAENNKDTLDGPGFLSFKAC